MSKSDLDFGRSSNIFLGQFLDRPLAIENFMNFSTLWAYRVQFSEGYCIVRFSPSISDREHLACREQFINVMSNDKYLVNFLDVKTFWTFFGQHFWLALDFELDRI